MCSIGKLNDLVLCRGNNLMPLRAGGDDFDFVFVVPAFSDLPAGLQEL